MIEYKQGDLFLCNAEAIVNTVNCVGVMGKGIALQFRKQFPENNDYYESACKRNDVVPGKMLVFETNSMINPKYIINFPTKRHWRGASRIEDIEAGLKDLINVIQTHNISSIAIPPLGCGLGGLDWNSVKPLIESASREAAHAIFYVYEPIGASLATETKRNQTVPNMTSGRAALISLIRRYLDGFIDPFISQVEIHKLMYFLQESGEPLRLNYAKGIDGPYAKNLSHVLNAIMGHMLTEYSGGDDNSDKQIRVVPGAEAAANYCLQQHKETVQRMNRVAELIDGFESPHGMVLLATVHWVAENEAATLEDVIRYASWGLQKQRFSNRQIELAHERLKTKGWFDNQVSYS